MTETQVNEITMINTADNRNRKTDCPDRAAIITVADLILVARGICMFFFIRIKNG